MSETLLSAARELATRMVRSEPFAVQTRVVTKTECTAFAVNTLLSRELELSLGAPLNVREPEQIVSVVIANDVAYLGVSSRAQNLSDRAGGMHRFAREPGQISRAEFKLLEALAAFDVQLAPGGHVLDLGAAPGGWTRVLRQRQLEVTAVDPAALDPRLANDRGVRHLRVTTQAYFRRADRQYDLVVNDMRMDAICSARLMLACRSRLRRNGVAVMTLKLPLVGARRVIAHSLSVLDAAFRVVRAKQLFHNRSEITVLLRPRT
jgi:23S rRNA (cytidine2498-2'-O)-methyltransferase